MTTMASDHARGACSPPSARVCYNLNIDHRSLRVLRVPLDAIGGATMLDFTIPLRIRATRRVLTEAATCAAHGLQAQGTEGGRA